MTRILRNDKSYIIQVDNAESGGVLVDFVLSYETVEKLVLLHQNGDKCNTCKYRSIGLHSGDCDYCKYYAIGTENNYEEGKA